jgi:hypothetical protein
VKQDFAAAARAFLAAQPWCSKVHQVTPVFAIADVLGVFRCTLIPSRPDADVMVWVVVGDLPSAYIVHEPGDSWQDALIGYVTEMRRWVDAVKAGEHPGVNTIPTNMPQTFESAAALETRLDFIQSRLLDVDPSTVKNDV